MPQPTRVAAQKAWNIYSERVILANPCAFLGRCGWVTACTTTRCVTRPLPRDLGTVRAQGASQTERPAKDDLAGPAKQEYLQSCRQPQQHTLRTLQRLTTRQSVRHAQADTEAPAGWDTRHDRRHTVRKPADSQKQASWASPRKLLEPSNQPPLANMAPTWLLPTDPRAIGRS